MAHKPEVYAKALAMLMTGESPRYVSRETGVPLTTVKRWRNVDLKRLMREIFPHGTGLRLHRLQQNGPKKEIDITKAKAKSPVLGCRLYRSCTKVD